MIRARLPTQPNHNYISLMGIADLYGDPDWAEISTRSARIQSDAVSANSVRTASWSDIAMALREVIDDELDSVARMEILAARMPGAPGVSHGVGQARRRVMLLLEGHSRLTTWQQFVA